MCGGINLYPSTEAHKQVWQFFFTSLSKIRWFFFFVTQKVAEWSWDFRPRFIFNYNLHVPLIVPIAMNCGIVLLLRLLLISWGSIWVIHLNFFAHTVHELETTFAYTSSQVANKENEDTLWMVSFCSSYEKVTHQQFTYIHTGCPKNNVNIYLYPIQELANVKYGEILFSTVTHNS